MNEVLVCMFAKYYILSEQKRRKYEDRRFTFRNTYGIDNPDFRERYASDYPFDRGTCSRAWSYIFRSFI
jgi:hypothetical protein